MGHGPGRGACHRTGDPKFPHIVGLLPDGTPVLLTTRYLDEADRLAGPLPILGRCTVTAQGTPDELKNALGSRIDLALGDAASADALNAAQAVLRAVTGSEVQVGPGTRQLTAAVTAGAVTCPSSSGGWMRPGSRPKT